MNPEVIDRLVNAAYHLGKKHTLEAIAREVPGLLDEPIAMAENNFKKSLEDMPDFLKDFFNSFDKKVSLTILTGMWDTNEDKS